ncbi:glycoside hydrolase superfamily [Umbelopsis sp. AD052]|nr:glycoside hydrolase superfamily [Umbelopsis sp. AD052]
MKRTPLLAAIALLSATSHAKTWLLPIPQSVEWTGYQVQLDPDFSIEGATNLFVHEAVQRYHKLITKERWIPYQKNITEITPLKTRKDTLKTLLISVQDDHAKLDFGIDEAYNLTIPDNGGKATLDAVTWVGALRGLETFSQVIIEDDGTLVAHSSKIQDEPTYPHRGIMLDTSRNFYSVESILRTLDAMAYSKLNVFHWHITDSQSWPLHLEKHPELAQKGAYSSSQIYTTADMHRIVQHAQSRGIRVIPEIDMPSHTASIAKSHPDLVACVNKNWETYGAEPAPGALDPTKNETYALIEDIVSELADIFPDSFFHAGGDEVNSHCWADDKTIGPYMKKHGLTTDQLWAQFEDKVGNIVEQNNKRAMIWEDAIVSYNKPNIDVAVQVWTTTPEDIIKLGHDIIHSSSDYFYLDCGSGGWVQDDHRYISPDQKATPGDTFNYGGTGGSWCAPYKTWQRIYSFDMTKGIKKQSGHGQVLGGEVALWSEQSDETVLDAKLWPRASAAAEVFWSGSYDMNGKRRELGEVWPRMNDWRFRLLKRGIGAIPIVPQWCLSAGTGCLI